MDEETQESLVTWGYNLIVSVLIVPGALAALQMSPWIWVIGGVCSLAILRAWERGYITPATWTPDGKIQGAWTRGLIAGALMCVLVTGGFVWSHWRLSSQVPNQNNQQPGNNPWVTAQEIETQRKLGRVLLTLSPVDLLSMFIRRQSVVPYQQSWIKIDYPFDHLRPDPTAPDPAALRVPAEGSAVYVVAYFPAAVHAKLLQLRPGDRVRGVCQFNRIEQGIDGYSFSIRLIGYACEFS